MPVVSAVVIVIVAAVVVSTVLYAVPGIPNLFSSPAGYQFTARSAGNATQISAQPVCSDSDKGLNLEVKGTCTSGNSSGTDYCWNSQSLVEYQCSTGKCVSNIFNCLNYGYSECKDGACVNGTNQTLPDLTVISLTATSGNTTNTTNTSVTLQAIIKNIGTVNAGASTTRFFVTPTGGVKDTATPALAPNSQVTVSALYSLTTGSYVGKATADVLDVVQESDENNNLKIINFTV